MVVPPIALVVEDDELQREMLGQYLKEEGIEVISCESAEAAELVLAHTGSELSLLVTDFRLARQGTGVDVAAFAKNKFPHLRVVVVSGDLQVPVPADVSFLRKPFHPRELLTQRINRGLG